MIHVHIDDFMLTEPVPASVAPPRCPVCSTRDREELAQFLYEARADHFGDMLSWTAVPKSGRYGRESFLAIADALLTPTPAGPGTGARR